MAEFKLQYEKFCFLKRFEERLMTTEKNLELLGKYGFEIKKKRDNRTEVYKKIRSFTDVEQKTKMGLVRQKIQAHKAHTIVPGRETDSLHLFI